MEHRILSDELGLFWEILKVLKMWLGFFLLLKIKWKGKEIRKGEQLNQKGTWT